MWILLPPITVNRAARIRSISPADLSPQTLYYRSQINIVYHVRLVHLRHFSPENEPLDRATQE
jgi:hypothetical protein